DGRRQRVLIASRPSLVQERAQLRARPRLLVDERATQREQSLEVDAGELTPKGAGPLKEALERGLDHRAEPERVARRDEVDRRAEESHAHRLAIGDERREVLGPERFESTPERDVRVGRDLRLHAYEPLDRLGG